MFLIKNIKRSYDCYLSDEGKWAGLLIAKVFENKTDAEKVCSEDGKVISWNEATSLYSKDLNEKN
ncbi:MAG: hypothetical protein ACI4V7_05095 [Succinivibrionaceae bacterium]